MWFLLDITLYFFHQKVGHSSSGQWTHCFFPPPFLFSCLLSPLWREVSCLMFKCSTQKTKAFISVAAIPSRLDCLTKSNSTERTHTSSHLSECLSLSLCSYLAPSVSHTFTLMYTHTHANAFWILSGCSEYVHIVCITS